MLQLDQWRPKSIQCNAARSSQQCNDRKNMRTYAITVFKVSRPDRSHRASNLLADEPSFNSVRKGKGRVQAVLARQKWQTSVKTNFAAAYWISVTSMPTVGLLLRASNVTPAVGGTGRPERLAAATAEAQWTNADLPEQRRS